MFVLRIAKIAAAIAACLLLAIAGGWWLNGRSSIAAQRAPFTAIPADAVGATARATGGTSRDAVAQVGLPIDHDLSFLANGLWRQATPPDPGTLDYVTWRDQYREWFARQFPWIFKIQAVLEMEHLVKVDYIELLMVSRDIWQFNYDSMRSQNLSLARLEPLSIRRLAQHYGVAERGLMEVVGLSDSALSGKSNSSESEYAESLRRWRDVLAVAEQGKVQSNGDVLMSSLYASSYLANTRTAAYLWTKVHPQDFQQPWTNRLRQQAVAAQSSNRVAMELLLVSSVSNGCPPSKFIDLREQLITLVASLAPSSPAASVTLQVMAHRLW